jgi:hypothetical protein
MFEGDGVAAGVTDPELQPASATTEVNTSRPE